jgi:hypothetical protein
MAGAASWLSRLLGLGADTALANINPDAPTPESIDEILDTFKSDLTRQNLVTLGRDFTPDDIKSMRHRARYGDPRFLYAMYDEMVRLGPGGQMTVAVEAMKSSRPQFLTTPEDWNDDSNTPADANPVDVANARAARDFLEDTLHPHLTDLIEIHADAHFYGIADSKIVLKPRGNAGRWDSIESVTGIPARRHRLGNISQWGSMQAAQVRTMAPILGGAQRPDAFASEWMLMLSPDSWEGVPVSELLLKADQGNEGLFFTEIGAGSQHLDQRGLLFQCLVPWNLQQYTVRWRAKFIELFGNPMRYALVDFAHPKRVTEAYKALKSMGSTSFGVFQTGTELKFAEAHSGGVNDPFETQIEWCVRQYDQLILGHSQMTGVQKGVGGKMQGAQATQQFEDITNSRLRTLSVPLSRTLGKTLVERNFGKKIAEEHAPLVKLRFVDRDDPEILSRVALVLKQAGAGELVATEDLVRRCALRLAEGDDKNLGAAPAAGGTGGVASTSMPMTALTDAEHRQALQALGNAESSEFRAIRKTVADYVAHEKKRALEYGRKRLKAAK